MTIDIEAVRADTASCRQRIHLNNAGASPSPTPVLDTVVDHFRREAELGGYEAAEAAADRLEATYASVARLVNGAPDEIALVDSATRAWNAVFYAMRFQPGDRILTGRSEYVSNAVAMLQVAARTGATVEVIDDDEQGQISLDRLGAAIDERVKLIALTHVPTSGGLVNPAVEVGRIAKEAGVPYLLDACQSAGQLDIDVGRIGCDALTATGRKFLRGPRGTGFAWVRRELIAELEPHELDLRAATWTAPDRFEVRDDARRFETWESSVAARLGLGAAVDYALALGLPAIEARVTALADHLRERLESTPHVVVHDQGVERCAIVTFTVDGVPPAEIRSRLAALDINVWVSTARQAQLDLGHRHLPEVVRASVHYFLTTADLDRVVDAVAGLAP